MPLCARCTAIYLFLGITLWAGLLSGRPRGRATLHLAITAAVLGCGILFVHWAGAQPQVRLWPSTSLGRILTGLACGSGLGLLVHTAFSHRLLERSLSPWIGVGVYGAASLASLALLLMRPPWPAAALVLGAASLAGYLTAAAWIQATLMSFVTRRGAAIASIISALILIEAAAMCLVRI